MISMSWRTGIQSTMDYFDDHLSVGDYYLDESQNIQPAQWMGEGAERLGLKGDVSRDDFEALANNLDPSDSRSQELLNLRKKETKLNEELELLQDEVLKLKSPSNEQKASISEIEDELKRARDLKKIELKKVVYSERQFERVSKDVEKLKLKVLELKENEVELNLKRTEFNSTNQHFIENRKQISKIAEKTKLIKSRIQSINYEESEKGKLSAEKLDKLTEYNLILNDLKVQRDQSWTLNKSLKKNLNSAQKEIKSLEGKKITNSLFKKQQTLLEIEEEINKGREKIAEFDKNENKLTRSFSDLKGNEVWKKLKEKRAEYQHTKKNLKDIEKEVKLTSRMNKSDNRRTFWDVAISPPKDVSVLAALGDKETREQILQIHSQAAKVAAKEMESFLGVRERKNGKDSSKVGNVEAVIATVEHDTARPVNGIPDPHLHTHLLIANAVYDRDSKEWSAMSNEGALEAQQYLRQVYYNEIVRGIESIGYKTETREIQKDFVISGMDRDLVDSFSRRHLQVKERADEKMRNGMWNREEAEEMSVLEGRESKVKLSERQLEKGWHKIAGEKLIHRFNNWSKKVKKGSIKRSEGLEHLSAAEATKHAKSHVFTNKSVVNKHDVLNDMLQRGRGNISLNQAKNIIEDDAEFLIGKDNLVTTKEVLYQERKMIKTVNDGIDQFEKFIPSEYEIPVSPPGQNWNYTDEQYNSIKEVLNSKDAILGINGVAGAGKTTLLEEIDRGVQAGGGSILPLAPSGQAVGVLRDEGFEQADTLQQWLVNKKLRKEHEGSLIVVDEAGMAGTPAMTDLLIKAKEHDCRILLVGDVKQIQSVERGDAFRLLQDKSKIKTITIEESRRQKTDEYKDSVTKIRNAYSKNQWATAWRAFDKMDVVKEVIEDDLSKRTEKMVEIVSNSYSKNKEKLIVASRWSTINEVNNKIRKDLIKNGELGKHAEYRISYEPVHLSPAEKVRTASYEVGQKISLIRNIKGIGEKGENFTVKGRNRKGLVVENNEGIEISLPPGKHSKTYQVYNERKIEFRENDKILIKANIDELKNGQIVNLSRFEENGNMVVKDKEGNEHELDKEFKHALQGYAVTSHSSQGATVEDVMVIADGMTKEQFYVAATRGKTGIEVLTTDRQRMEMNVAVSGKRKGAVEIIDPEKIKKEMERQVVSKHKSRKPNEEQLNLLKKYSNKVRTGAKKVKTYVRERIPRWLKNHEALKQEQKPKLKNEQIDIRTDRERKRPGQAKGTKL